jgi:toxin ParE1/3/4
MTLGSGFHPEARAELHGAIDRYDNRAEGVGSHSETAVLNAIGTVLMWPDSGRIWPGWTGYPAARTTGVTGFPYRVVYYVENDELTVVVIAHDKRKPGYWRDRLAS